MRPGRGSCRANPNRARRAPVPNGHRCGRRHRAGSGPDPNAARRMRRRGDRPTAPQSPRLASTDYDRTGMGTIVRDREHHDAFVPRPMLRGGHAMTIYSWGNPRDFPRLPPPTRRFFDVAPGTRVAAACHWQTEPQRHATLLALHGLNGSSDAHYMRGLAAKAFERGMNVVRLNQRNCGDTEHLAVGLFHSGLTADAAHVVDELTAIDGLPAIAVAGYSLGGNLALKLAGEYGAHPPKTLLGVAAVSPIIEIEECTRALERRENFLYEWNFVKDLKRRMRRKNECAPGVYDLSKLAAIRT